MTVVTSVVQVGASAYVSLGTSVSGMWISTGGGLVEVIAAASQPTPATPGHPLAPDDQPFFFPLAAQVWAIARTGPGIPQLSVRVTF